MLKTITTVVATLAVSGITCADDAVQWTEAEGGNGHWYKVIINDTALCWPEAEATAMSTGGQLASLETVEEFNFASTHIDSQGGSLDTWIGLRQDEGGEEPADGWRWLSGVELDYNLWLGSLDDGNGCQDYARLEAGGCDDVYPCVEEECIHSTYEDQMLVEWSADCNGDGIVDYGQILDGTLEDLNQNGVPDCCDQGYACFPPDCNNNGIDDSIDLANGTSQDCNGNEIPDECDVADGTSDDCNGNGVPDECETLADCDGDGTPDVCEILNGAIDANPADGVPDECQGLPVGACCVNGQCSGLTAAQCFELDGNFAGVGISCADANCPTTCAGDVNGDNQIGIIDLLTIIDGWGFCP